ncbi:MAG: T9SS type A sorting domain-containing protein, partial [Lentimicrobiaceae bacterium]|nr:T9SS type A sorting domain-containing protein [Lentimicrobiaceae bacterium]
EEKRILQALLDSCLNSLGTKSLQLPSPHLRIYPNPTTGKLSVVSYQLSEMTGDIEIFDVVGQIVGAYHIRPTNDEIVIDISHLANGMYFLKIDGKVFKVVKE